MQQALTLQQTYTSTLCGHVNVIHSKLAKLETQSDKLQAQLNTESDYVELNTPEFDPDIDEVPQQNHNRVEVSVRDILTSPDTENTDATGETEDPESIDGQIHNTIPQNSYRPQTRSRKQRLTNP